MLTRFNESIWGDEGFSAILSMKPPADIIRIIINDTSPPLWNLTQWVAFQLFGTSEVVIRGLASFYFLIAVFFAYKIGAFVWNKKTGFLATVLTFLNPFFFSYAFEGRMYSIMAAGVAGAMYFFLKLLKGDKKLATKVGFVLFNLWALYSHHFAIFMLFIQGFWFLVAHVQGRRASGPEGLKARGEISGRLFKLFIAVGIGYLPWLYPLYNQTRMVSGGFWLATPNTNDLFGLYAKYLGAGTTHVLKNVALTLTLVVLATRKWLAKPKEELVLASWFVGPIALTWVVSQFFQPIFFDRYLLYAIPGATILLAAGTNKFSTKVLFGLIAILIIIDIHYFTHPTKRPFRELAERVHTTMQDGDYIVNWYHNGAHHLWETKYYDIEGPIYVPSGTDLPFFVGTALIAEDEIITALPQAKRIGAVTSGPLEEVEIEGKVLVEEIKLPGINFGWFE